MVYVVNLSGDDLLRYSNKIEPDGLIKCPCENDLIIKAISRWAAGRAFGL